MLGTRGLELVVRVEEQRHLQRENPEGIHTHPRVNATSSARLNTSKPPLPATRATMRCITAQSRQQLAE